jgi:hypothetical protein
MWTRAFRPFMLIMWIVAASASALHAQRHENLPLPAPGIPDSLGVNIHFNDPRPGEMEQLAAAGFPWIRQDFTWAGIEREPGHYDFTAYERLLAALQPHQIRPIFILDYGNDLYEKGSPRSPEARAAFARFAAAAVTHFKNRGILWEMWNEPNGGFWSPRANVDEYIALALETGKAIRQAAPDEWYIGPGVSGMDFTFMERCFQAGLLRYWDAVSFHPYRNTPPETAADDYRKLREIMARYAPKGKTIPILSSEWGYSELYPGLNLEKQSRYIVREFLTNLMNGLLVSIWYDWHDDGTDPKEPEHHFGTVYNDYRPKPTYIAAQTLAAQLKGFRYNKRLALEEPADYCLLFNAGAEQRLVVWTTAAAPHEAVIPASVGDFRAVSMLGEQRTLHAGARGLKVTLTEAPQYLIPQGANRLLTLAAAWHTVPATIYTWSDADAAEAMLPLARINMGKGQRARGTLTLAPVDGPDARRVAMDFRQHAAFSLSLPVQVNEFRTTPLVRTIGQWRGEAPQMVCAILLEPGIGQVSQEFAVRSRHPLRVTVLPVCGGVLPVRVDNPNGTPFDGRILLGSSGKSAARPPATLHFAIGETTQTLEFPFDGEVGQAYSVSYIVEEQYRADWVSVLDISGNTYTPLEAFAAYPIGEPLPFSDYQIVPDGDPKVKSEIIGTIVAAPAGLPGGSEHALRIAYDFDPGWKFLRLAHNADLLGKPVALGMWLYGDGSGDLLRARVTDATGQTFQADGGSITWKGWRYVSFPLNGQAGHWGGANDGVIHIPLRMDTPLLIDSPGGRGGKGVVYVTGITLITNGLIGSGGRAYGGLPVHR